MEGFNKSTNKDSEISQSFRKKSVLLERIGLNVKKYFHWNNFARNREIIRCTKMSTIEVTAFVMSLILIDTFKMNSCLNG